MFLPLSDEHPASRPPIAAYLLLGSTIAAYLLLLHSASPGEAGSLYAHWGFVPGRFQREGSLLPALTYVFLHGGVLHLVGNMLFLWIFADNVEDRLGTVPFLLFYFAAGVAAAFGQYLLDAASRVPIVGASGAISGVLGCYLVWYPSARIRCLAALGPYIRLVLVPAWFFLPLWFLLQLLGLLGSTAGRGGVAYGTHVGGFLFGVTVALLLAAIGFDRRRGGETGSGSPET